MQCFDNIHSSSQGRVNTDRCRGGFVADAFQVSGSNHLVKGAPKAGTQPGDNLLHFQSDRITIAATPTSAKLGE
jgi:hypothetical protein